MEKSTQSYTFKLCFENEIRRVTFENVFSFEHLRNSVSQSLQLNDFGLTWQGISFFISLHLLSSYNLISNNLSFFK